MSDSKKLPTIEVGDTVVFRTDLEAWVRYGETQLRQVMLDIILTKESHVVKSVESDIKAFNIEGDSGYFYSPEMVAEVIKPSKARVYSEEEVSELIEVLTELVELKIVKTEAADHPEFLEKQNYTPRKEAAWKKAYELLESLNTEGK